MNTSGITGPQANEKTALDGKEESELEKLPQIMDDEIARKAKYENILSKWLHPVKEWK